MRVMRFIWVLFSCVLFFFVVLCNIFFLVLKFCVIFFFLVCLYLKKKNCLKKIKEVVYEEKILFFIKLLKNIKNIK